MEGRRIFGSRKMIALTMLLLGAIVGLFVGQELQAASNRGYSLWAERSYHKEVVTRLKWYSEEEAQEYLTRQLASVQEEELEALYEEEYDTSLTYRSKVLTEELEEITYLLEYPAYVEGVVNQSSSLSSISIFQNEDSLAAENMERTGQRYAHLLGISVDYGNYKAVTRVMEYDGIHIFLFIFICILVWNFFEDEKKGLRGMFYATPGGREMLALRRIGVLAAGTAVFVGAAYLLTFAAGFLLYGGIGDLGNSVQSVACFMKCTYRISIVQYLLMYVVVHTLASFVLSLFLWLLFLLVRNRVLALLTVLIVLAGELVLNQVLGEQSLFVWLKYENLYYLIRPDVMLQDYLNFRIFGRLVNREVLFGIGFLVLGAVSGILCVAVSSRRKTIVSTGRLERWLQSAGKKVQQGYHRLMAGLPLTGMEWYQILISRKGLLIGILWLALLLSAMDISQVYYMGSSTYMQEVYQAYSGEDDGGLREYVEAQTAFFAELDARYEEVLVRYEQGEATEEELSNMGYKMQAYTTKRSGLESIKNQLAYMDRIKEEQGIDAWFVDNKGYKILWTGDGLYQGAGYGKQEQNALFAVAVLILLLGMLFSYDRSCGMESMIQATPLGREKLFAVRMRLILLLCLGICLVTYGLMVYEVNCNYPLTCLTAPVQSLLFMNEYPLHINILTFMLLLFGIHLLMLVSVAMVICALSVFCNGYGGILLALLLLVLPSALQMLGVSWCKPIAAIQPIVYVEALQEYGFFYSSVQVLAAAGIGLGCYFLTRKKWCHT